MEILVLSCWSESRHTRADAFSMCARHDGASHGGLVTLRIGTYLFLVGWLSTPIHSRVRFETGDAAIGVGCGCWMDWVLGLNE